MQDGADPILVARRNGHTSTRMVLDRYGHLFERARRQAADAVDRIFADVESGRQKFRAAAQKKRTPIPKKAFEIGAIRGGDEETRTPDPLHAKQVQGPFVAVH